MSNQANIRDIQILDALKASFGRFGEDVSQTLASLQKQFEEIDEWLEEREDHWQRQVGAAQEEVYAARRSLSECESQSEDDEGNSPDCNFEEEQVADAERILADYEEKLETVKQWRHRIEGNLADFQNDIHRLSNLATSRTSSAQTFLANKIEILNRYVGGGASAPVGITGLVAPSGNDKINGGLGVDAPTLQVQENILSKRVHTEKLLVFNPEGKLVLEREGDQSSVEIFPEDRPLLENAVITHNHPSGRAFSPEDLRTAVNFNIAELRAVGVAQPYTYVLRRPRDGWPKDLADHYVKVIEEVEDDFSIMVERGELTADKAKQTLAHESMVQLAKELTLDYERITRA